MGTALVVGAQTAYQLSWVALLVAPLVGVVLAMAAQVGVVARADLQSLTRRRLGPRAAVLLLVSVVAVNLITMAADLQAGAAGTGLIAGVDPQVLVLPADGLVVSALVALPVLVASTAYIVGAQFDWRRGLSKPLTSAGLAEPPDLGFRDRASLGCRTHHEEQ